MGRVSHGTRARCAAPIWWKLAFWLVAPLGMTGIYSMAAGGVESVGIWGGHSVRSKTPASGLFFGTFSTLRMLSLTHSRQNSLTGSPTFSRTCPRLRAERPCRACPTQSHLARSMATQTGNGPLPFLTLPQFRQRTHLGGVSSSYSSPLPPWAELPPSPMWLVTIVSLHWLPCCYP